MGTALETTAPAPLVSYHLTDEQIETTRAKYAALEATTPKGYEEVRQAIAVVRGTRTAVERRRVELKADALDFGRRVDAEAKRLTVLIESIENPLVEKKKLIDDEEARLKAEAAAAKVRAMEAEIRANLERQEAARLAAQHAEEERLAIERAALAAEREQMAEERRQTDAARAEARAIEEARQQHLREQERLAHAAEEARLAAAREVLDRERRELEAARREADRVEFERAATAKAAREAAEQIEADRLASVEREARIAAVMPDAKKLDAFAASIRALRPPAVKTKKAKDTLASAVQALESVAVSLSGLEKQVA